MLSWLKSTSIFKDLDFIEIGTSNFSTIIQSTNETIYGMSIEPIRHYLDSLPNKKNVIKLQAAITDVKIADTIDIYYVPEQTIIEKGLNPWLRGCNSINKYHPIHLKDNLTQYVTIDKVPLMTIHELYETYKIRRVRLLKIDTEGHDCIILRGLFNYLIHKSRDFYPHKIVFETNENTSDNMIDDIIKYSELFGYKVESRGEDTVLVLY